MSKELVVSSTRHETRVAVLEDDQLVEIYYQRQHEYSLAGSVHKGRVTRVLPGMQSAFVDIGLERDAFLYVSDFFEDNEEYDAVVTQVEEKVLNLGRGVPAPVPAPAAVLAPAPEETPANGSAAPAGKVIAPPAAPPEKEPREAREVREARGDRDRRGRRNRRRRGRPQGLPESKFASVAAEDATPAAGPPEEIIVLPGESLAKYSAARGESVVEEPVEGALTLEETEEILEAVHESDVEAVVEEQLGGDVPEENGLGEELSELPETLAAETETEAEPEPEPDELEATSPALAAEVMSEPPSVPGDIAETAEAAGETQSPASATEETQFLASATEASQVEGASQETTGEVGTEMLDSSGPPSAAAEGSSADKEERPEPARIPTSLTATLREQGGKYMHRVSRRMRRKMREQGGQRGAEEPAEPEIREAIAPQPAAPPSKTAAPSTRAQRAQTSISDLLKEGQEIIVQIAKEPLGQKGARITSYVALPGRFVVYMPTVDHVGVSRKISSEEERQRLKRILQTHRQGIPGGFILRTAGEGQSEEDLRADMLFLYNLWLDIRQKAEKRRAPALIYHDLDVVQRVLRDQLTANFKNIWVDNEEIYETVVQFVQRFQPALVGRVKLYTRSTPIFDTFNITSELEKALRPKVWLKSGGYIVINQTEALVAIDVNTGKFVGKSNRLEDTIVKTNTDAIREIVRQIRLRDLGGIIVVDFIDMDERKNRQKVMQTLEEAMRADRAPYKILSFNDFGLVAITRKRVKQSLERTLCSPCPYCDGAGYVKSVPTVITEIIEEARKIAGALEKADVTLRVNPEVAKVLKSTRNDYLQEIEDTLGRQVVIKSDPLLHQEKFDLA
jgi:Rne/Rng family ribonuclease